ncbi:uncharacterized protein LOC125573151 [Nematostella vectensis]|uniref:uncharacterized protein LOC125573151 n=1 Tax=Nematostella vectensis TaxID=45351 RepID=UPI00207786FB|nr:uncharacterized protein LOC125573151 [Nematostella vectensis]
MYNANTGVPTIQGTPQFHSTSVAGELLYFNRGVVSSHAPSGSKQTAFTGIAGYSGPQAPLNMNYPRYPGLKHPPQLVSCIQHPLTHPYPQWTAPNTNMVGTTTGIRNQASTGYPAIPYIQGQQPYPGYNNIPPGYVYNHQGAQYQQYGPSNGVPLTPSQFIMSMIQGQEFVNQSHSFLGGPGVQYNHGPLVYNSTCGGQVHMHQDMSLVMGPQYNMPVNMSNPRMRSTPLGTNFNSNFGNMPSSQNWVPDQKSAFQSGQRKDDNNLAIIHLVSMVAPPPLVYWAVAQRNWQRYSAMLS